MREAVRTEILDNYEEIIMDAINEKYLTRMLDSAQMGLTQVNEAIEAINQQLVTMNEQREEMEDAVSELSALLGIADYISEELEKEAE